MLSGPMALSGLVSRVRISTKVFSMCVHQSVCRNMVLPVVFLTTAVVLFSGSVNPTLAADPLADSWRREYTAVEGTAAHVMGL